MVGPWPHRAFTFRALSKTYGQMWVRCDVCRRYARLRLAGLRDVDYREKTFSCSRCGAEAYLCLVEPIRESGMADYRLDEMETPERHPEAAARQPGRGVGGRCRWAAVSYLGGRSIRGGECCAKPMTAYSFMPSVFLISDRKGVARRKALHAKP